MFFFKKKNKQNETQNTAVSNSKKQKSFFQTLFNTNQIDEELYSKLKKTLIQYDFGVALSDELIAFLKKKKPTDQKELMQILKEQLNSILATNNSQTQIQEKPELFLIIGSNGVGKTTSIAKLAHHYKQMGKKVLLVAGDTFRAAAIEQLIFWAKKIGVDVVSDSTNHDAGALIYNSLSKAQKEGYDIVLADTSGRLSNKEHLMKELEKVKKVAQKFNEKYPQKIIQVVDSNTGQSLINQIETFASFMHTNGLIITKTDGNAKFGILFRAYKELKIPIKYNCFGEKIEDIQEFDAQKFIDSIF